MRYREPFTLYLRTLQSGKKVWYYQTYDQNDKRTCGFSTGKTSKTAARAYCYELFKKDMLIPKRKLNITFKQFAVDWWVWDKCEYLSYVRKRKNITRTYADTAKGILDHQILDFFSSKKMRNISSYDVEKWLDSFSERGLSNSTAKLGLAIIKVMFKEAVRRQIITSNPAAIVKPLKNDNVKRGVLTQDEVRKIFDFERKDEIWGEDISYYANLLAACTGMRIGEIIAVRGDCLEDKYIRVDRQYKEKYGLVETKTHRTREVVIPKMLMDKLNEMSNLNGGKFVFSVKAGRKPVSQMRFRTALISALDKIGIDDAERRKRNICFHSWRHYLNTTMRSNNIMDGKLRAMVGHSSKEMTEHYTQFNTDDFKDIQKVQNKILDFTKAG